MTHSELCHKKFISDWFKWVCLLDAADHSETHPATAGPAIPLPARRRVQPARVRASTSRSRHGWAWSECSPCRALWPGTPAPCRWASGQTPRPRTQRSGATSPCPRHGLRCAPSPAAASAPGLSLSPPSLYIGLGKLVKITLHNKTCGLVCLLDIFWLASDS